VSWQTRLRRLHERLSGRLTPPEVTPLDRTQLMLLPIADLFMILMFSRPPGGSLRTARVTLVTIWLAAGVAAICTCLAAVALAIAVARHQPVFLMGGLLSAALAIGSGVLVVFGVRQRGLIAAAGRRAA
jgi:hypothetical protein